MNLDRRHFLRMSGLGLGALGLTAIPKRAFAADNDQVLLTVFLRGGMDGMSVLHPAPAVGGAPSPARLKYEAWRQAGTRVNNGIIRGRLAMHPALEPLVPALDSRHLMVIGGVAGAQQNRSHFEQQDLVESGAGETGAPLGDGVLARALDALGRRESVLSGVSLNTTPPQMLKQAVQPGLSIPDFRSFGRLRSSTHTAAETLPLESRIDKLYVPGSGVCNAGAVLCENGQRAAQAISRVEGLRVAAGVTQTQPPRSLPELLGDVAKLVAADAAGDFKCLTLDVGGWDTHLNQGNDSTNASGDFTGTLAINLGGLASALASFYDECQTLGLWSRMNVLVMTEFGRTTRQNGTAGTDHGYGGTALLMGNNLRQKMFGYRYFPRNTSHAFYGEAESTNALPRSLEHRQLFAEVLTNRLGVEDLSSVLPGFTPDAAVPSLYS